MPRQCWFCSDKIRSCIVKGGAGVTAGALFVSVILTPSRDHEAYVHPQHIEIPSYPTTPHSTYAIGVSSGTISSTSFL